jgi:hypothetical protein
MIRELLSPLDKLGELKNLSNHRQTIMINLL